MAVWRNGSWLLRIGLRVARTRTLSIVIFTQFNNTEHTLKIVTFNCHGFKSSVNDVLSLCETYDIIFLQELWLFSEDLTLLKNVHKNFDAHAICAMNDDGQLLVGRPYGGIGIMWRKNISHACNIVNLNDVRLLGINVDTIEGKIFLLNVYLPYQSSDNYEEYCNYLGKIASIIEEKDSSKIVIAGDFNAAVNSRFETELLDICDNFDLVIYDYEVFGRTIGTFTYVSDAHNSTSWLDHFICSRGVQSLVTGIHIIDKLPSSDHLPVGLVVSACVISAKHNSVPKKKQQVKQCPIFKWTEANDFDIRKCGNSTAAHLGKVQIPESFTCTNCICSENLHRNDINKLLDEICSALRKSSLETINICKKTSCQDYVVPGWNDYVKEAHCDARNCYILWRNMGKPKQGPICQLMRRSRLHFKYLLKQCQQREEMVRADAMAKSLHSKDVSTFWKNVSNCFENILLELMEPYLSTTDNQFGFKKGHSTDHCIYVLKNVIQYYRSYNSPVYTCFLDASKAFDRVNHWTLFKKLLNRGVPILLVRILLYWYRTQTFCIKWGTMTSCFFSVSNGVRQGGILSPYIFAIYMDDLSVTLNNAKVGCHINNRCANHMLYADDLCVIAPSPRGLQSLLDICSKYGLENEILYNPAKSSCLVVKPTRFQLKCPDVYINHNKLDYVVKVKYLGVVICDDMKDDEDMLRHLRSFYARSNSILRKFHNCSVDVKLYLFHAYCCTIYCSLLWVNFKKSTYAKLKVAYNNMHRRILGYNRWDSASNMFVSNAIDNFDASLRKNIYRFRQRVYKIDNNLIKCLNNCKDILNGPMWSSWSQALYCQRQ